MFAVATLALLPLHGIAHEGLEYEEPCHRHDDSGEPHCHFEVSVPQQFIAPPHPLVDEFRRLVRVVGTAMSVEQPPVSVSALGMCSSREDCPDDERCAAGFCTERSFRPLGVLFESLHMSYRLGGPGATIRIRW